MSDERAKDATLALVEAAASAELSLPEAPPDLRVERGWRVKGLEDADWALGRIRDLRAELEENKRLWESAHRRVEALNQQVYRGIAFFEAHVLAFMSRERATILKGGRKKSRALINGTIGWRRTGGGLEVEDPAKLLAWAMTQDPALGLVRYNPEPAMAAIRQYADHEHIVPPGMREAEEKDAPYVKPSEDGLVLATRKEE